MCGTVANESSSPSMNLYKGIPDGQLAKLPFRTKKRNFHYNTATHGPPGIADILPVAETWPEHETDLCSPYFGDLHGRLAHSSRQPIFAGTGLDN